MVSVHLVPDPCPFEVEIDIVKLKKYKLAGSDQIFAELIQATGKTVLCHSFTHSFILFGIRRNCDISGRSVLYQFVKRSTTDQIFCIFHILEKR
jgi:hypothetical protein